MALTPEQQSSLEFQNELARVQHENQIALINKQAKVESIRLAKEILIENSRTLPVGEREITAEAIAAMATTLNNYTSS
jgi:hypothetical protein